MQTLMKVIADGRLGRIWRVHSRMDQDGAQTLEAGSTGGVLRDLGSHVVDQMLFLLGPVVSVDAQMDFVDVPQGTTNAGFTIALRHASGAHSHVSASKLNHIEERKFRACGELGCYVCSTTDMQAQLVWASRRPAENPEAWGYEPKSNWGTIYTAAGAESVPSEQGRYHDCYAGFARAVREGAQPPVTALDGERPLAVLDAARKSANEGCSVRIASQD